MNEIRYIDLYFFWNFASDALALYLLCRVLPRAPKVWRLALSAAFGALCACAVELLAPPQILTLLVFCAGMPLSLYFAFGRMEKRAFLRALVFYPVTLCLLGGLLQALSALSGIGASDRSFGLFSFLALCALALVCLVLYLARLSRAFRASGRTLILNLCGKTQTCACLCDSANLLIHRESGLPVILAGADFARRALSLPMLTALSYGKVQCAFPVYPVPFQGASGGGVLYGIRISGILLCRGAKKRALPDAILAPDFSVNDFAGFDLLLPAGYTDQIGERKRA